MKELIKKLTPQQTQELTNYKRENERSGTEAMRVLAIILFDSGSDSEFIKNLTEYDRKYAASLRRKYIKRGITSLNDRKGKKPRALLTKGQREEVIKNIKALTPKAFGIDTDYWTTSILAALIKEQYNVQYKSRTPISILFKEARFTYHKPDKQYHARDQRIIDLWIATNKPVIQAYLDDKSTVLLVADEMMLSTQTTTQKLWLPQGEFPKIDVSSKREIRCIYGALNVKSGREHAFKTMRANSKSSCDFLESLGNLYKGYKIVLVWDNASWHKSAEIKHFLTKTKHNFHLINFPPYAPELNPQEHVWKAGRAQVTHNNFIADIDTAANQFVQFLNKELFDYKFF